MKEVVNNLTGEIVEIPEENNELIKKEMNQLITDDFLESYAQLEYYQEQIELWKFKNKEAIKEIFKKNGIKSFKNDYIEITYIAPTVQRRVNTGLLKEAGLYEAFTKEIGVDEQLRVKVVK